MQKHLLYSLRRNLNLQKWSCFSAMIVCALIQALYLFLSVQALWPFLITCVVFPLSLLFIYALNLYEKKQLISNKLDLSNRKEKLINNIICKISKRLGIAIDIEIVKSTSEVSLEAGVVGFPHENKIFLSEDLVKVYQNGLTQSSLEALIAHELCHILKQDPLLCFVVNGLRITLIVLAILSLCCSPIGLLSLLHSVATSFFLLLSNELCFAGFSRAKECLADLGAVELLKKPQSVLRFIYDNYLQFLYWGKLVLENERASQTHFLNINSDEQAFLKKKHRQLTSRSFQKIYHLFERSGFDDVEMTPLSLTKNYCLTWFNTHPTIKERSSVCEQRALPLCFRPR